MITKTSVLDVIGFDVAGTGEVAVRIAKCEWLDGVLIKREPHRFVLEAGDNVNAMLKEVNSHLVQMGYGEIDPESVATIRAEAKRRTTPERAAAVQARRQAEQARHEAARVKSEQELTARAAAQAQEAQAARAALKAEIKAELEQGS